MIAAIVGGGVLNRLAVRRAWTRAGRAAGLTPEGGGILSGRPDFTGRVDGRPVRVRTYDRSKGPGGGSSGGGAGGSYTYTVVETDLDRAIEDGFVVAVAPGHGGSGGFGPFGRAAPTVDGDTAFSLVGGRAADFEAELLSGRSAEALAELRFLGVMTVGDATQVAVRPGAYDELLDVLPDDSLSKELASGGQVGPTTVSHTASGALLDADDLQRQVDAVAAVADAVDRVTADGATHPS